MLFRIIYFELLEIGVAAENLLMIGYPVILAPSVRAVESIGESANVRLSVTDQDHHNAKANAPV